MSLSKLCIVIPQDKILANRALDSLRKNAPCEKNRSFTGMQLMGAPSVLLDLCATSDETHCGDKHLLELLGDIIVCAEEYCTYTINTNGVLTVVKNSDSCPAECDGCVPWLMAILYRLSKLGLL